MSADDALQSHRRGEFRDVGGSSRTGQLLSLSAGSAVDTSRGPAHRAGRFSSMLGSVEWLGVAQHSCASALVWTHATLKLSLSGFCHMLAGCVGLVSSSTWMSPRAPR